MSYTIDKIKATRTYLSLSQEQMADILGISRLTYASIESWKRDLKKAELEKLATVFETTVESLMYPTKEKTKIENNHPLYKMIQTILYILSKCAGKPNVWKIVLNKLLYFADFNYFEKYGRSITNDTYVKMPMWPVPKSIDWVAALMEQSDYLSVIKTTYHWLSQIRYIPNIEVDLNVFNAAEITEINSVIEKYSDKNWKWLTEYSHEDTPRKNTKNIWDVIEYWLVDYRTPLYAVTNQSSEETDREQEARYDHSLRIWFWE